MTDIAGAAVKSAVKNPKVRKMAAEVAVQQVAPRVVGAAAGAVTDKLGTVVPLEGELARAADPKTPLVEALGIFLKVAAYEIVTAFVIRMTEQVSSTE